MVSIAYDPSWDAGNDRKRRDVPSHDGTGAYCRTFPDGDPTHNRGVRADGGSPTNPCGFHFPVGRSLYLTIFSCSSWKPIVNEHHSMSNEYFIFNCDTFTNKSV